MAVKRLVKVTETVLKVYKRKQEQDAKDAIDKKMNISYGSFYDMALNKSGGLGLKLSNRGKYGVHVIKVIPGGAAKRTGIIHQHDRIRTVNGVNFTVNSTVKEVLAVLKNASGDVVNFRFRRPYLREYPQKISFSSSKKSYRFTTKLKTDRSVVLGQCICRGFMTGTRCTSLHFGKNMVVLDPPRQKPEFANAVHENGVEKTETAAACTNSSSNSSNCSQILKPYTENLADSASREGPTGHTIVPTTKFVDTLSNDVEKWYLLLSYLLLCFAAYFSRKYSKINESMGRNENSNMPSLRHQVRLYGSYLFLLLSGKLFLGLNYRVSSQSLAKVYIPTPNTWGNMVFETCDSIEDSECLYHSFVHEHAPECLGTFLDCAKLLHAVSSVGAIGPFYRTNYTLLPPGHPSSSVCKIGQQQAVLIASVYSDGSETNASKCNVEPLDLIANASSRSTGDAPWNPIKNIILLLRRLRESKSLSLLQKTSACESINCSFFVAEGRCGPKTLFDPTAETSSLVSARGRHDRLTPMEAQKRHLHRPGQGNRFLVQMTKNVSAGYYGDEIAWVQSSTGPALQGRPGRWDEFISDPSLTMLTNGTFLLLYKGWSRADDKSIQGKIGIAVSHTGWSGPFVRYGSSDGVLLSPRQKNVSYGEPYLYVDRKNNFHVFFVSSPALTCPSEILHAFTNDLFDAAVRGKGLTMTPLPLVGCEKAGVRQKLVDGNGKDRNGIWREKFVHPDEVVEYGRPSFYYVNGNPIHASLSVTRHNTPVPRLLQNRWDERLMHSILHKLGLLPHIYEYESEPWPAKTRTVHRELIQGVQGIVFDEDSVYE